MFPDKLVSRFFGFVVVFFYYYYFGCVFGFAAMISIVMLCFALMLLNLKIFFRCLFCFAIAFSDLRYVMGHLPERDALKRTYVLVYQKYDAMGN